MKVTTTGTMLHAPKRRTWADAYNDLQAYIAQHGNALIAWDYETADGFNLGRWVYTQRSKYVRNTLSAEKIRLLEQLEGWEWELRDATTRAAAAALDEFIASQGPCLDPRDTRPRYRQVADALTAAIEAGYYRRGDQLPSHSELIRRFGSTRETIRAAIEELGSNGLAVIVQSKGTFVPDVPTPISALMQPTPVDDSTKPRYRIDDQPGQAEKSALTRRRVGERIRQIREEQGKGLRSVGEAVGVSHTTLRDIEIGIRSMRCERLFDIAEALEVPPQLLLGEPA